jgi:hypothetical protein
MLSQWFSGWLFIFLNLTPIKLFYRIRPQNEQEITEQVGICLSVTPGQPQIIIGGDGKAFTYGLFRNKFNK